ncbi:MAG: hypothetical protein ACRC2R_07150 [Xenococcaceae cyanobacterium]
MHQFSQNQNYTIRQSTFKDFLRSDYWQISGQLYWEGLPLGCIYLTLFFSICLPVLICADFRDNVIPLLFLTIFFFSWLLLYLGFFLGIPPIILLRIWLYKTWIAEIENKIVAIAIIQPHSQKCFSLAHLYVAHFHRRRC